MPSIESSPHPLIFRIENSEALPHADSDKQDHIAIRTLTRALDGMQKEAIVNDSYTNTAWRMVCDEGPWLHGTDLSSFPLGFFSAGMIASLATEILALGRRRNIPVQGLSLVQDARYAMEGSAVKRTMKGTALPLETEVRLHADSDRSTLEALVYHGLAASPADAVMRTALGSRFRITRNGHAIDSGVLTPSDMSSATDPTALFDGIRPALASTFAGRITEKLQSADLGAPPAAQPLGMATEQKREVRVRASLQLRDDGLQSIQVQCIKPEGGSVFNFLSDTPACFGGQERAPTGLQYLSAGVAFCYMTQLGRFAGIVKQDLAGYRVVQDTCFSLPGGSAGLETAATAQPVDTHVFIDSSADDEANRVLVAMGEQTCYLHACYRGVAKTKLKINSP